MSEEIKKVAFIGLGKMGAGMAANILKAGFELAVYNRTQSKMKPLVDEGATGTISPAEACSGADAVVTNLMDDRSVMDIVTGEKGVLAGLKSGAVHIGTTTNSPACATQVAELHAAHGSSYIAAPVLGRPNMAAAGELRTWVAGDPKAVERCKSLLESYTSSVTNLGTDPKVANTVKLINNYIAVSQIELMGQVYAVGEKNGVDLEFLNEIFKSFFANPGMGGYATRVRTRDFDPAGFELVAGYKDVGLMLQMAADAHSPLNYADVIKNKMLSAFAHGMAHKDWSAIYEITRMNAGLK
jgi:3-hydroxyisobutyrate dehydrogenase-like beta-hydroxyacid dehydrogenase